MSLRTEAHRTSPEVLLRSVRAAILAGSFLALGLVAACSEDQTPNAADGDGVGTASGTGGSQAAATASGSGGLTGSGGTISVAGASGSGGSSPSDAGFDACTGAAHEQEEQPGPLDIYFIFDRTRSMLDDGDDCAYVHGDTAPESSKACYATYALNDYLISADPNADTRFALQFMTLADDDSDCDGEPYATPHATLQSLPLLPSDQLIQDISDENFEGDGSGTHIEGALRGLSQFTSNPQNQTPGREMIGVLMTDGEPNGCEEDIDTLAEIIADHYAATGIRTFIIGMEGAIDEDLEILGQAGGAEPHDDYCGEVDPPCHYWNVEDGSDPMALASALQAIIEQSAPLPCEYAVAELEPPAGETIDYGKVNLTLTQAGTVTTIGWVPDATACPTDVLAWYYDNPTAPTTIHLCPNACATVSASQSGANVTVVLGCTETTVVPVK